MRSFALVTRTAGVCCALLFLLALLGTGCQTGQRQEQEAFSQLGDGGTPSGGGGTTSDQVRPGDVLTITFKGPSTIQIPDHQERVPQSGQITLQYIGKVDVIGRTRVELQDEIRSRYVPRYFKELAVTIVPDDRFFFVYGDVRLPGRYPYGSEISVTGAISTAGGFTDFANEKKVLLIQTSGARQTINCKKVRENPEQDPEVSPGDRIYVPRRRF